MSSEDPADWATATDEELLKRLSGWLPICHHSMLADNCEGCRAGYAWRQVKARLADNAAALRQAEQREREACALIAVSWAQAYMSEDTHGDGRKCGEQIAAAIRARGAE